MTNPWIAALWKARWWASRSFLVALNWLDDATLVFEPDSALPPSTDLTVELGTTALAANGLAMLEPVRLLYRTAAPLQAIQVLPQPGTVEADPSSAIVTTFDQPVVPLGADPETLAVCLQY